MGQPQLWAQHTPCSTSSSLSTAWQKIVTQRYSQLKQLQDIARGLWRQLLLLHLLARCVNVLLHLCGTEASMASPTACSTEGLTPGTPAEMVPPLRPRAGALVQHEAAEAWGLDREGNGRFWNHGLFGWIVAICQKYSKVLFLSSAFINSAQINFFLSSGLIFDQIGC